MLLLIEWWTTNRVASLFTPSPNATVATITSTLFSCQLVWTRMRSCVSNPAWYACTCAQMRPTRMGERRDTVGGQGGS